MPGSIYSWSITSANNATADGDINWQEFQDPATVNNSARQMMGRVGELITDLAPTRTSTGAVPNAYLVSSASIPSTPALPNGFTVSFVAHATNTGPCTLAVGTFGAVALRGRTGVNLNLGEVQQGQVITAYYNLATNEFLATGTGAGASSYLSAFQSVDLTARILKVGFVMQWPVAAIPAGWLECNGSLVSRATYPELFAAYGTTYSAGDGSTTFGLPDYRGRFLRGWSNGSGIDPDASTRTNRGDGTAGDNVGTRQASQFASHTHAANVADPTHAHPLPASNQASSIGGAASLFTNPNGPLISNTNTSGFAATGITVTNVATGGLETRPTNINVVYCCLASPPQAAAGALGVNGLQYAFGVYSATAADPGAGQLSVSSANLTPGATGTLYISANEATTAPVGAYLASISSGNTIKINAVGTLATYAVITLTAAFTSVGGVYYTAPYTVTASNGTFPASRQLSAIFGGVGPAGVAGPGYAATSTTSLTVGGSGSRVFTTQTGLAYAAGARIRATSVGSGEYMEGVVTSYSGSTLTATMDLNFGTSTQTDWSINIAGARGAPGAAGAGSGDMLRANNLSDLISPSTARTNLGLGPLATVASVPGVTGQIIGNVAGALAGLPAISYTSGTLVIGLAGTATGQLQLAGTTSGVVTVKPAAASGTWSLTLPTTAGAASQVLQTDGAGNTSWATVSGGAAGASQSFETRALAVAATISATVKFLLLGSYATLGDAPLATYARAASAPSHNGYFTSADGAFWVLQPTDHIHVRWLGAKVDGVTDDSTALINALNMARATNCRLVYMGSGSMLINSTNININGVVLKGDDPNRSIVLFVPGGSVTLKFQLNGAGGLTGGGLRDLTVWASSGNCGWGVWAQGDRTYQPDEFILDNIKITGAGTWDYPLFLNGQLRTPVQVGSAVPSAGGSAYTVGNTLTLSGGTFTVAATLTVTSVSSGAVTGVSVLDPGVYTVLPTNPVASSGGSGTGATFTISANGLICMRAVTMRNIFLGQANLMAGYFLCVDDLTIEKIGSFGGTTRDILVNGLSATFKSQYVAMSNIDIQGSIQMTNSSQCTYSGALGSNLLWTSCTSCTFTGAYASETWSSCTKCSAFGSRGAGAIAQAAATTTSTGNQLYVV